MLGTQMWIGEKQPNRGKFKQPENQADPIHKPDGGLWTSTVTDDGRSGWLDTLERLGLYSGDENVWFLEPEDDLEVLLIEDEPHLNAILENYRRDDSPIVSAQSRTFAPLDFEAIAENYAAIRLTEEGQWNTRMTRPGLYGWDSETVLWLQWSFADMEYQGNIADYIEVHE
jgi:hypothetical protein